MSGKPSIEGAEQFIALAMDLSGYAGRAAELAEEIQFKQSQLEATNKYYADTKSKLVKLMNDMDLRAHGNTGFEERMMWFLVALCNQAAKGAK